MPDARVGGIVGYGASQNSISTMLIDSTARTRDAEDGCYASDTFQELPPSSSVLAVCAALNSTVFQLMVNMAGRTNFGGGLLKIQTYEVADLLCVSPDAFTYDDTTLLQSSAWVVLSPSPARSTLDTMLFDALGLTQAERDAVDEEGVRLVEQRVSRANSVEKLAYDA